MLIGVEENHEAVFEAGGNRFDGQVQAFGKSFGVETFAGNEAHEISFGHRVDDGAFIVEENTLQNTRREIGRRLHTKATPLRDGFNFFGRAATQNFAAIEDENPFAQLRLVHVSRTDQHA